MPLPGGTSELCSTRPNLIPLLATRCLYQGRVHLKTKESLLQTEDVLFTTKDGLLKTEDKRNELRSSGPKLLPLLAIRCLYWGLHLSSGQLDPT